MMTCYKCGYKDYLGRAKTICPVCGTNNTVPKFSLILFLTIILFIILGYCPFFSGNFELYIGLYAMAILSILPFAIKENVVRANEIQDGFRIPDYPSEIINGEIRVPDFKSFDYVDGLQYDKGVDKIMLETCKDGLNYYCKNFYKTQKIDYSNITGLNLKEENNLNISKNKGLLYGLLLGAIGGVGAGLFGGAICSIENKKRYVLDIQFKENEENKNLSITSDKCNLINLINDIEDNVNENND